MFKSRLDLRAHDKPNHWVLLAPLIWDDGETRMVVPRGFITDLSSHPWILRGILNRNGKSRKPAVGHDWPYAAQDKGWPEASGQTWTRSEADRLFAAMNKQQGVILPGRVTYFSGVRAGGWWAWRKNGKRPRGEFFVPESWFSCSAGQGRAEIHCS